MCGELINTDWQTVSLIAYNFSNFIEFIVLHYPPQLLFHSILFFVNNNESLFCLYVVHTVPEHTTGMNEEHEDEDVTQINCV